MKPTGISFLAGISKVKKRYIIYALCALCWIFSGCGRGVFYAVGTEYKSVPDPPLSLLWERKLDAAPMGRVLNAHPLALQMSTGASLYAFDPYSGDKLGKKTFDRGICGPPALVGDVVLVGSQGKEAALLAWDRRLEDTRWKHAGTFCLPPVVRGDTLFVSSEHGLIRAVNFSTGALLWERNLEVLVRAAPVLRGNRLIVGDGKGVIRGLRLRDGQEAWRDSVDSGVRVRPLVGSEHIWLGTAAGQIAALDGTTGVMQWQVDVGGLPSGEMALTEGILAVGSADRSVYGIEASTGSVRWTYATEGVVRGSPVAGKSVFYIGSSDGYLYALDASGGDLLWKFRLDGAVIEGVSWVGEMLVVMTEKKILYAFGRR